MRHRQSYRFGSRVIVKFVIRNEVIHYSNEDQSRDVVCGLVKLLSIVFSFSYKSAIWQELV